MQIVEMFSYQKEQLHKSLRTLKNDKVQIEAEEQWAGVCWQEMDLSLAWCLESNEGHSAWSQIIWVYMLALLNIICVQFT